MHIIQSHWSAPTAPPGPDGAPNAGGWPSNYYRYMAMLLSSLLLQRHYGQVELFTDKAGADLLIGKLKLPYQKVSVCLDQLNAYNPELWALPKLLAYSQQRSPFLHIDHDVFLWEPLPTSLHSAPLVAQSSEFGFTEYEECFRLAEDLGLTLPEVMYQGLSSNHRYDSINAGVLGGTDTYFFAKYTKTVFDFLRANYQMLGVGVAPAQSSNLNKLNVLLEQYTFYHSALSEHVPVAFVAPNVNRNYSSILNLSQVPITTTYTHLFGQTKGSHESCEQLEYRLRFEFPRQYASFLRNIRINKFIAIDSTRKSVTHGQDRLLQWLPFTKSAASACLALRKRPSVRRQLHRWRSLKQTYSLLKRSTVESLLSEPLTLSRNIKIIRASAFSYTQEEASEKKCDTENFIVLYFDSDDVLQAQQLKGFEVLLYYFQNRKVSGYDIIDALKKENESTAQQVETQQVVLDFICSELVYSGNLRPTQRRKKSTINVELTSDTNVSKFDHS